MSLSIEQVMFAPDQHVFLDKTLDAWHDSVAIDPPLWTEEQAAALAERAAAQAHATFAWAPGGDWPGGRLRCGLVDRERRVGYIALLEMEDWSKSAIRVRSTTPPLRKCWPRLISWGLGTGAARFR